MPTNAPKPIALFIVGEPGVGKTTLVRALIAGLTCEARTERVLIRVRRNGADATRNATIKWTLAGPYVLAGHYDGSPFDGADTCDMNPYATLDHWAATFRTTPLTVFDGDRFSIATVKQRVAEHATALVIHLSAASEVTAARRTARSVKAQNPEFVAGRLAKSARFAATFAAEERLSLDASDRTSVLAATARAWIAEHGVELPVSNGAAVEVCARAGDSDRALDAPTLCEPQNRSANPPDGTCDLIDEVLAAGETVPPRDAEAPGRPLAQGPPGNGLPRADVRASEPPDGPPPPVPPVPSFPVGSYAAKRDRLFKMLVAGNTALNFGIRHRDGELVEVVAAPTPIVHVIPPRKLALFLDAALEHAGTRRPETGADDATSNEVPRWALKSYAEHFIDMHAWPGIDEIKPIAPEVEIEAALDALYRARVGRGPFQVRDICDEAPTNRGVPTSAATVAATGSKEALRALPVAAYEDAPLGRVFGDTCDLDATPTKRAGVWCRAGAVFRKLEKRHPVIRGNRLTTYSRAHPKQYEVVAVVPPLTSPRTPTSSEREVPASSLLETPPTPDAAAAIVENQLHAALGWTDARDERGVRKVRLTGEGTLADDSLPAPGAMIGDDSYGLLLRGENVDVYKPDGSLLLSLRAGVLPDHLLSPAWRTLRDAAVPSKNRGAAAGVATAEGLRRDAANVIVRGATAAYVTTDGRLSNTSESNQVLSGIVGNYDAAPRTPYCRQSAYTQANLTDFALGGMPLIEAIDEQFRLAVPDRHEAQRRFVERNSLHERGWMLGDTTFSTVTVNKNFRTGVHRDAGDYAPGFGNLTVLEGPGARYEGGLLVFPRFRVAVDVRTGDFLAMDVHEWHANTELRSAVEGEDEWERVSVVCYVREAIAKCGTADEEDAKYERWLQTEFKTPGERHAALVAEAYPIALPAPSIAVPATYDPIAWPAFVAFAREELRSGDLDPIYPVLRHVYDADRVPEPVAIWRTLVFLAVYNLKSAEHLWTLVPEPGPLPAVAETLARGSYRRKLPKGDGLREHIDSILHASAGSPATWLRSATEPGGEAGWRAVYAAARSVRHYGPYFSYKVADLLAHVHDFPITADSIGDKPGRGPFAGMMLLTGLAANECTVVRQRRLLDDARRAGVPFVGLDQLETALCAFNSLAGGDHYCGASIDELQETLAGMDAKWWTARRASFPTEYLGEDHGRCGIVKSLLSRYRDVGEIVRSDGTVIHRGRRS